MLKLTSKHYLAISLAGLNLAAITLPLAATADTQTSNTSIGLTVNPVITSY